jgi:peroxiredoxin
MSGGRKARCNQLARAIGVGCALLMASGCGGASGDRAAETGGGGGGSGRPVRLRLSALDGGEIDLARYRGQVVVLHLFDTDNAAATLDTEQLEALAEKEPKRVTVVGICLDPEGYKMASAWRRAVHVRYLIALADGAMIEGRSPLGKVRLVPTTLVLDRSGSVAQRIERPLRPGELDELIEDLLE